MDIKRRRITYLFFFLAFFIVAPIILAYALGYRLVIEPFGFTKVGAAYINSQPKDASIYLNGKATKHQTPNQLLNITPGLNELAVTKEGYQPWSKKLEIKPGQTTFAEDIYLFLEQPSEKNISNGGVMIESNEEDAWLQKDQELLHFAFATQNIESVAKVPANSNIEKLSADKKALIYSTDNGWFWLDSESGLTKPLNVLQLDKISYVSFGRNSSDLWVLASDSIYNLDIRSTTPPQLVMSNVVEFAIYEGKMALITTDWQLEIIDLFDLTQIIEQVQLVANASILDARAAAVLVQQGNEIAVIRDNSIIYSISADKYDWLDNAILFYNLNELWSFDLNSKISYLIDRTGAQFQMVSWHPSLKYFTRLQNNNLEIVEIDNRGDKRHITKIAELPNIRHFSYNKKGDSILVVTPETLLTYKIQ